MKHFLRKIINFWAIVRGCWVLVWRSVMITTRLKFSRKSQRSFVNKFTRRGAIKILSIAKANYHIIFDWPIQMSPTSRYIFMSNHQSLLDLPLIYATVSATIRLIAKQELFKIPFFGKALSAGECIPVNRTEPDPHFFLEAKKRLDSGLALWIFPEGTRSKTGGLLPFKAGAFRLARETAAMIIPVAITGTGNLLPPGKFEINFNQEVTIRIGQPIDTQAYDTFDKQRALMDCVRSAILSLM